MEFIFSFVGEDIILPPFLGETPILPRKVTMGFPESFVGTGVLDCPFRIPPKNGDIQIPLFLPRLAGG